jgi:hypothetical protein
VEKEVEWNEEGTGEEKELEWGRNRPLYLKLGQGPEGAVHVLSIERPQLGPCDGNPVCNKPLTHQMAYPELGYRPERVGYFTRGQPLKFNQQHASPVSEKTLAAQQVRADLERRAKTGRESVSN